ncbi:hypothetical protein VTO73DRAFT_3599 [Trametes versicolor]
MQQRSHGTKFELDLQLYGTSPELESHDARTREEAYRASFLQD